MLLCSSYSNAQTAGTTGTELVPGQIYNTGNIVLPTVTGSNTTPWVNGVYQDQLRCWAWGDPGNCGPNATVRPGGYVNYSYGTTDLYQVRAIAGVLPSIAGLNVNGFNFGFTAKNGNGWDNGQVDYLSAYVKFYDKAGGVATDYNWNLTYKYNWTTFNFDKTFTTPYASKSLSDVRYGIVGRDSNFWAGTYGPEVININFSLKYSVDPCAGNPLYSPTCSGYGAAMVAAMPVASTTSTASVVSASSTGFTGLGDITAPPPPPPPATAPPPPPVGANNGTPQDPTQTAMAPPDPTQNNTPQPGGGPQQQQAQQASAPPPPSTEQTQQASTSPSGGSSGGSSSGSKTSVKINAQAVAKQIQATQAAATAAVNQQAMQQSAARIATANTQSASVVDQSMSMSMNSSSSSTSQSTSSSMSMFGFTPQAGASSGSQSQSSSLQVSFANQTPASQSSTKQNDTSNSQQSAGTTSSQVFEGSGLRPPAAQPTTLLIASSAQTDTATFNNMSNSTGITVATSNTQQQSTLSSRDSEQMFVPLASNVSSRTNPVADMIMPQINMQDLMQQQTAGSSVKQNVAPNDLAVGVDINTMASVPVGFSAYSFTLTDAAFYAPREVYRNQVNVDNVRLLRSLSSDRLHQDLVNLQYK